MILTLNVNNASPTCWTVMLPLTPETQKLFPHYFRQRAAQQIVRRKTYEHARLAAERWVDNNMPHVRGIVFNLFEG